MGGSALILVGKLREEIINATPKQKSLFDKLLNRKNNIENRSYSAGNDRTINELPIGGLKHLPDHFTDFINKSISAPNDATKSFLEYLKIRVITIHVRSETGKNAIAPDWYIQFSFSGCSGMAEVSAELGTHWATVWYLQNTTEINDKFLEPYGFSSELTVLDESNPIFIPVKSFGYGLLNGEPFEEEMGSKYLQFDQSQLESRNEEDIQNVANLDETIEKLFLKGTCHCQFCDPMFKELEIE
jgi:hypothetical protein